MWFSNGSSVCDHSYHVIILTYKMEKWLSDLQFLSMFTGAKWASMSIALASTLRAWLITPACHFLVCWILRISELTLCKVSTNCASEDFSRPCGVVHKYVDFSFLLFFVCLFPGVGVCLFVLFRGMFCFHNWQNPQEKTCTSLQDMHNH